MQSRTRLRSWTGASARCAGAYGRADCVVSLSFANTSRALSRALAIVGIAFVLGMIAHKGHNDISVLAEKHSGQQLWVAVARYYIGNLAGGDTMPEPAGRKDLAAKAKSAGP